MVILEYKAYGKSKQLPAVDEAPRTARFLRNKALHDWMDNKGVGKYGLSKCCKVLAAEFRFVDKLNSLARQAAAHRAWGAIAHFYDHVKKNKPGEKGSPRFRKRAHSVEYKTFGGKLAPDRKRIPFTDGPAIGSLKLKGTRDLSTVREDQTKRVRIIRRADGYYVQFGVAVERRQVVSPSQATIGLDVGLERFYTDSTAQKVDNPRFLWKAAKKLKKLPRRVRRKKKGSKNRRKTINRLARVHLQVERQRRDFAVKTARCVVRSNDLVAFEDLQIRNMVKNGKLAKSISDAAWGEFRRWLEYFGRVYGKVVVAVPPQYTSQQCSDCGATVMKALSERTHRCPRCGTVLDRDQNAAINILRLGLEKVGRGTPEPNAWGEGTSTVQGSDTLGGKPPR